MKRITVLFLLFAVVTSFMPQHAGATKYYSQVTVKAQEGKGLVYASESAEEPAVDKYGTSFTLTLNEKDNETSDVYLFAKPMVEGEVFKYWTDSSNNIILGPSVSVKGSKDSANPNRYEYTAVFGAPSAVRVGCNEPSLGKASIDKVDNKIGDKVTVSAPNLKRMGSYACRNLMIEFVGWRNEKGEIVSSDASYTFVVEEPVYLEAVLRNKNSLKTGGYYRVRNIFNRVLSIEGNYKYQAGVSNNFLDGLLRWRCPDDFLVSDFHDKEFNGSDDNPRVDVESLPEAVIWLEGTDLNLNAAPDGNALMNVVAYGQGTDTRSMTGKTMTIKPAIATSPGYHILYGAASAGLKMTIRTEGEFTYNSALLGNCKYDDPYSWMAIQPIDEAHMDEFWFGASADESMDFDGGYWTSMYTGFPYECRDGVEAYYASKAVEANGLCYINIEKIESGIVPPYSAVLLKCQGTRSRQNRLLPLDFNGDYPALEGNLLSGVFQLYTDKERNGLVKFDESTMRIFGRNTAGELGFYKLAPDTEGSISYLKTNKVYLDLTKLESSVSGPLRIRINKDGSSGMGSLEDAFCRPHDDIIYDLNGRRVLNPQPGSVYIRNGRKFIMRNF